MSPVEEHERQRALVSTTVEQVEAVARAVVAVASAEGRHALSALGAGTATHAGRRVLGHPGFVGPTPGAATPGPDPAELADQLGDPWARQVVARVLAVASLADGELESSRIDVLAGYTEALGAGGAHLEELQLGAAGRTEEMTRLMMQENLESIPGMGWDDAWTADDIERCLAPYRRDNLQPELAARFQQLGGCPPGSLGRSFYDFYTRYDFAFPGEHGGLNQAFATHHDSTHLVSGYNTSLQGELLVSTFTATLHEVNAMSGHVIPVLVSWHVGTTVNEVAKSSSGWYDPERFFVAWARGAEADGDTFAESWTLWDHAETDLAELRRRMDVGPLDPAFAPEGPVPSKGDVHRPPKDD